jgi:hypothetical protein
MMMHCFLLDTSEHHKDNQHEEEKRIYIVIEADYPEARRLCRHHDKPPEARWLGSE